MKALQKDLFFRQKASQVGDFILRQAVSSWSYSNMQEIKPGAGSEMRTGSGGRERGPEEDESLKPSSEKVPAVSSPSLTPARINWHSFK